MIPKYYIGQSIFEVPPPEGIYYRYHHHEHLLLFVSDRSGSLPTRSSLLFDRAEFALAVQENILFFLARFGRLQWRMAPCLGNFVSGIEGYFPNEMDHPISLQILLVVPEIGYVQGVRQVLMEREFAQVLNEIIEQQAALPSMAAEEYLQALDRVKAKYPKPKDLVTVARVRMTDIPSSASRKTSREGVLREL